jgi:hypothetical protein
MAPDPPVRIAEVRLTVRPPDALPAYRRPVLRSIVEHCTIHNSLMTPPKVAIELID